MTIRMNERGGGRSPQRSITALICATCIPSPPSPTVSRRPVSDEDVHEISAGDAARPERRALSRALRRHVVGPVERHRDVLGRHRPVEALGRHRGSELREGAHLGDLHAHRFAGSGDTHAKLDAHLARFLPGALRSRPRLCFRGDDDALQRRPISRGKRRMVNMVNDSYAFQLGN